MLKKGGILKYRKWDSKTKAKIVPEGLQNQVSLAGSAIVIKLQK